jgi:hypothetical protein
VRAHLREARGGRLDGTDDDEEKASRSDAPSDDEREASSSSDDDVSVRARRRPPPRPKGRHAARNTSADPRDERATNETARTEKTNDAFRGWLSGAAGRLARDDETSARGEKRDSKTPGGFSPEETNDDAKHDFHVHDDASEEVASETALETAFFAQTAGDAIAPSSALDERNAFGAPPPRASLDLGSALGGLDLDGLLSRLEAPGGEAVVASSAREEFLGLCRPRAFVLRRREGRSAYFGRDLRATKLGRRRRRCGAPTARRGGLGCLERQAW